MTTQLKAVRTELRMTKAAAIRAFVAAARRRGKEVPAESTLARMFAYWENDGRQVREPLYQELFCEIYNRTPATLGFATEDPITTFQIPELSDRFDLITLDGSMVELFEAQTQNFRLLDRKMGTARLLPQTKMHVAQVEEALRNSYPGKHQEGAAAALAEAAALAGWQSLDTGDIKTAWMLHETAKAGARQSEHPAVLAHVTAQQAYILLDIGKSTEAANLIASAHSQSAGKLPRLLRSWLYAAEGEAHAAAGNSSSARACLQKAEFFLPADPVDEELPFLMLNESHLARWKGNCLARLGEREAIDDLTAALEGSKESVRAQTGLLVDLASALHAAGDVGQAHTYAKRAAELAGHTGSARQRARISSLLNS